MKRWLAVQAAGLALAALAILLLARSGLDFAISALAYSPQARSFPLKDAWALAVLGHSALKYFAVAVWLALPVVAASAPRWRAVALHAFLAIALAAFAVAGLREVSAHSCPWDLADFGGAAQWYPVLGAVPVAPGPGRCLPAAHASTGFALLGLYFALRDSNPRLARWALALSLLLGLVAGAVQVARGAHFVTHALWTAWISWALNVALYAVVRRLKRPA